MGAGIAELDPRTWDLGGAGGPGVAHAALQHRRSCRRSAGQNRTWDGDRDAFASLAAARGLRLGQHQRLRAERVRGDSSHCIHIALPDICPPWSMSRCIARWPMTVGGTGWRTAGACASGWRWSSPVRGGRTASSTRSRFTTWTERACWGSTMLTGCQVFRPTTTGTSSGARQRWLPTSFGVRTS